VHGGGGGREEGGVRPSTHVHQSRIHTHRHAHAHTHSLTQRHHISVAVVVGSSLTPRAITSHTWKRRSVRACIQSQSGVDEEG
jgi:hypothetical protein